MRYGVQVNSLGPDRGAAREQRPRIVLEALAVTLSRDARARASSSRRGTRRWASPAPGTSSGALRIQQVLANETDLLEYPDIFEGSVVMDGLVDELIEGARD